MIIGLAPMYGYSDFAYRTLLKQFLKNKSFGTNFLFVSEFISADGFVYNELNSLRNILSIKNEHRFIVQIFGSNINKLLECTNILQKNYKLYGIELNLGCPSKKITKKGGGAGMLMNRNKTLDIIKKLRKNIKIRFSIKTRIGLNQEDKSEQFKFLTKVSDFLDCLTIHGRTLNQGNSGNVDREYIYELKNKINKNCLLLGNGGITTYDQIFEKIKNLDGVMIGQGAIGNPWIFTGKNPSVKTKKKMILNHLKLTHCGEIYCNQLLNTKSKLKFPSLYKISNIKKTILSSKHMRVPIEFRKHLFDYIKGLDNNSKFKEKVFKFETFEQLENGIINYFKENFGL